MISKLHLIIDCVRQHQPLTASQVAQKTGINPLTVHRHLSGGRGKLTNGLFNRVKVEGKRVDSGNRVRGTYHYLYTLNDLAKMEPKRIAPKKIIQRDPITAALFGASV